MTRVAIVGGGVSGLVAAYRLRQWLGPAATITVYEQSDTAGGKLRTVSLADGPVDVGAEAFVLRNPAALRLAEELGLDVVHPARSAATVHATGHTVPLPKRTFLGVPADATEVAGVLSAEGRAHVAAEPSLPPLTLDEDRAVGEVLAERFGRELVDTLVEPLLGGVYAGRADRLGLRATMPPLVAALDAAGGSLTAAAAHVLGAGTSRGGPIFGAFPAGMATLIDALTRASAAEIRLGSPVTALRSEGPLHNVERGEGPLHNTWRLEVGSPRRPSVERADAVVLAVPAPAARRLLADVVPAASDAYATIEVGSMAVVSLALPPGTELPGSSGVLLGVGQRHADGTPFTAKAFTYTSTKWGGADGAPVRLRASVGRAGDTTTLRRDDDALLADVRADLAELTGVTAAPLAWTVTRWGGGLPQYGVGHADAVAAIERAVADVPGLAVAGAVFRGVGIPACVDTATAAAERVAGHLSGRVPQA
jgi:protoporphyrinogen/coproporphyrinogen III oxidase